MEQFSFGKFLLFMWVWVYGVVTTEVLFNSVKKYEGPAGRRSHFRDNGRRQRNVMEPAFKEHNV